MIWRLVRFLLKMLAAGVILIVLLVVGGIYAVHQGWLDSLSSLRDLGSLVGKGIGALAAGWFLMEVIFGDDSSQPPPSHDR